MTPPATMSMRAYAASRRRRQLPGSTLKAVQVAIAAGRIPVRPDGTIDRLAADEAWDANTDASRVPHTRSSAQMPSTLAEAKRLESIERTRQLRFENDLREKRLIAVADAERIYGTLVIECRTRLLGVPSRLKGLRSELTRADLEAVDQLIRECLEGLAEWRGGEVHVHVNGRPGHHGGLAGLASTSANGTGPSHPGAPGPQDGRREGGRFDQGSDQSERCQDGGGPRPPGTGAGESGCAVPVEAGMIAVNG